MRALIGRKAGMTQVFDKDGNVIPVTVIQAGPCVVTQVKTKENDGYTAIQVGFGETKTHRLSRAERGHLGLLEPKDYKQEVRDKKKPSEKKLKPLKTLKEFRQNDISGFSVGQELKADIFKEGEIVDVTGVTKGRGFTGPMKRHNFSGGPMSHGSMIHRKNMSIGDTNPNRVIKGKRMPGHYGHENVTVQNLLVAKVDAKKDVLLVRGAVPGPYGELVVVREAVKKKKEKGKAS